MGTTKIEWAERSWSPITGCSPISEGCQNCYAARMAKRLAGRYKYPKDDPFKVTFHPERLDEPGRWKKPSMIFVVSMGDLFHEDVSEFDIKAILYEIAQTRRHTFLCLTKRPERMVQIASDYGDFRGDFPNLWLGVTAENQQRADERIPKLLSIPAAKHFVSIEPMLGPVNLNKLYESIGGLPHPSGGWATPISWVICGGETGPKARPMHPDWVRSLRDECVAAGVPFFFKGWGEWQPVRDMDIFDPLVGMKTSDKRYYSLPQNSCGAGMIRVGKKKAGRELDGRLWEEMPNAKF